MDKKKNHQHKEEEEEYKNIINDILEIWKLVKMLRRNITLRK